MKHTTTVTTDGNTGGWSEESERDASHGTATREGWESSAILFSKRSLFKYKTIVIYP